MRQVSSLLATRAGVIALTFLTGLIVARVVGPAGKGVLTVVASFVTLASVFTGFGFATGGVHLYKTKKYDIGTITAVSGVFWVAAVAILAMALAAGGEALARVLSDGRTTAALRQEWLWLGFATLPALLVSTQVQAVLLVDNRMRLYAYMTLGSQIIGFALAVLLVAVYRWGVTGALLANVAAHGATLLMSFGWLWSLGQEGRLRAPRSAFAPVLRASGGPYLNAILANVFKHGEGILLALLLDLRSVGYYGVALSFYTLLTEVPRAMVWPLVGRMTDAGADTVDVTARGVRTVPIVMIIPVLLMVLVSPFIIPLVYGAAFAPAGTLLAYMCVGVLFRAAGLVVYSYMVVVGKLEKIAGCVAVAAVVNLLLDVALVPRWGLTGVAVSNVAAEFLLALLSVIVLVKHSGAPLRTMLTRKSDIREVAQQFRRAVRLWK